MVALTSRRTTTTHMSNAALASVLTAALVSFPALAQKCEVPRAAPQAPAAVASAASAAASAAAAASKPALVDLNCTDSAALEVALRKLEGIGEERAKAIAKARPYRSPDDLVARQILPPAAYAKIKSRLVASKPPEQ